MTLSAALSPAARAQDTGAPGPVADEALVLVGFWAIDYEGMRASPRFAPTLESEQGMGRVQYGRGVLFEFTPDSRLRTHLGNVQERELAIDVGEDGTIVADPGNGAWIIEFIDEDHFAQRFEEGGMEVLYARSWDPMVGRWRVAEDRLAGERWYASLDEAERAALASEVAALRVDVSEDGRYAATIGEERLEGRIRFESTTPPAAGLGHPGGRDPVAHFVRREEGAAIYHEGRTWPLAREAPPSEMVVGRWRFDVARAREIPWIREAAGETPLEEFLAANVRLDEIVEITPTTWRGLQYAAVDERGDQFAVEADRRIPFWVRVLDEDHFLQMGSFAREYPFVRVEAGDGAVEPEE